MAEPRGDKLVVNLSAARTRARLKGFGHGVRKVHSAGRNQALIIHTATGRHLDALKEKFADVGFASGEVALSEPLENIKNLGAQEAQWLRGCGIRTLADLRDVGPPLAFRMVRQKHPEAPLNLLWAIAAGVEGRDWRDLDESEREALLADVRPAQE